MKKKSNKSKLVELLIDEADLAVDYFRCASRINPHAAVANYKRYQLLKHDLDKRALFVAQHFLFINSHVDFAKFLHALNRKKEKGITLQWTLSNSSDSLDQYPSIIQKFKKPKELLEWLGIERKKLVRKAKKIIKLSDRKAKKIIDDRVDDIIDGLRVCRDQKLQRQKSYNATKHGKPILSVRPELIYNLENAKEIDGPHFFYQNKNKGSSNQLRSDCIPFSDAQFDSITSVIVQISDVIRDLVYFFVVQNYPEHLPHLQTAHDKLCDFRDELPNLFK